MPTPSYCNVGPEPEDKAKAVSLLEMGWLQEAVDHGRVHVEGYANRLREVHTLYIEERSGETVAICCYGEDGPDGITLECHVSSLIVDPYL